MNRFKVGQWVRVARDYCGLPETDARAGPKAGAVGQIVGLLGDDRAFVACPLTPHTHMKWALKEPGWLFSEWTLEAIDEPSS